MITKVRKPSLEILAMAQRTPIAGVAEDKSQRAHWPIPNAVCQIKHNFYVSRLRRRILPTRPRTLAIRLFTFPARDRAAPDELRQQIIRNGLGLARL